MTDPTSAIQHLTGRLIALEGTAAESAPAADRALLKLHQPFGRLVGRDGFDALVKRAQHIAAGEGARLPDARSPDVVLLNIIKLLVTFIGLDLTTNTLRSIWPDVSVDDPPGPAVPEDSAPPGALRSTHNEESAP